VRKLPCDSYRSSHGTRCRSNPGRLTEQPFERIPYERRSSAPVAQWTEQLPSKQLAAGSNPAGGASAEVSEDDGALAVHQHAVLEVGANRPGQDQPLKVPAYAGQITHLVAV
jgi:hypothetical protein